MWRKRGDENRFSCGRNGDHLVTPFQCDLCIFRLLKGDRDPRPSSHQDTHLLVTIRRMNLDALWGSESGTVASHRSAINLGLKTLETVGVEPPYPRLGPYPREDVFGYKIALQMLLKSLEPGARGRDYQQFATIRRLRSAYTGIYQVSSRGLVEDTVLGSGASQTQLTSSPTESLWFRSFVRGCEKRMGKESDANVAMSGEAVRETLREIMTMVDEEDDEEEKKQLLCLGSFVVITYVASLRGYETFYVDLAGLRTHLPLGKNHPVHPHVVIPLLGRFKGETGERCHLVPLPLVTSSGIQVGKWVELLVSIRASEGRVRGPAFCDTNGDVARSGDVDALFIQAVERVQARRPDLFKPGDEIAKSHGISRTLRKGSNSEALAAGVTEPEINRMNRWRKVERAAGRQPKFHMIEHYAEVLIMLAALLRYPSAL